jgi:hypothetical protein
VDLRCLDAAQGSGFFCFATEQCLVFAEIAVADSDVRDDDSDVGSEATATRIVYSLEERWRMGTGPSSALATTTSVALSHSADWMVLGAEDESVIILRAQDSVVLWRNDALKSKRSCMAFMNTIVSVVIAAAPPRSSVFVVFAAASDGDVMQWVVNPRRDNEPSRTQRDVVSTTTKKTLLQHGVLLGMCLVRQ